jgi:hypothetical protein
MDHATGSTWGKVPPMVVASEQPAFWAAPVGLGRHIGFTWLVDDPERASRGGWVFDGRDPVFGCKDLRWVGRIVRGPTSWGPGKGLGARRGRRGLWLLESHTAAQFSALV